MNEFCKRESNLVVINGISIYCEKFKASSFLELHEQPTVDGKSQITNHFRKLMKFSFSGRIYNNPDTSMSILGIMNTMYSYSNFTVNYRGIDIEKCAISGIVIEDNNEDFISISINVVSPSYINLSL